MDTLLLQNFDQLISTPDDLERLNRAILDLAVHGKLTQQEEVDEPAEELLKRIRTRNEKLTKVARTDNEEIPFDLPRGWAWAKVRDLGQTQTGATPPTSNHEFFGEDYPFIKPANITEDVVNYSNEGLSKLGIDKGRFIKANSILMVCIGGSIGKVGYVDRDCSCNQQINVLTPSDEFISKFIYYFFKSPYFQNEVFSRAPQTTLPILSKGKWEIIPLPIPPRTEQQRIVARVEELFTQTRLLSEQLAHSRTELDRLNESALSHLLASQTAEEFNQRWSFIADHFDLLTSTPGHIAPLRQTILELAVRGKLTHREPDDKKIADYLREIAFEKTKFDNENEFQKGKPLPSIQEDEIRFDLPVSWKWVRLNDICVKITDGFHETPIPTKQGYPYVLATHVKSNGIDFDNCFYVSEVDHKRLFAKATPRKGDVLVVSIGAGSATPAVIDVDFEFSFKNVAILNKVSCINTKYLFYYLLAIKQNVFDEITRGGAQPYLSLKMLKNLVFPLAPHAEQERIVKRVEQLLAWCDSLETQLTAAEQQRHHLLESVLAQIGNSQP
jgi:type I restriction enzyme, S subunit